MKTSQRVKDVVRKRDVVCVRCGSSGSKRNRLTIHHKKPRSRFPELAGDPNNCELLCMICHRKEHNLGNHKERRRKWRK